MMKNAKQQTPAAIVRPTSSSSNVVTTVSYKTNSGFRTPVVEFNKVSKTKFPITRPLNNNQGLSGSSNSIDSVNGNKNKKITSSTLTNQGTNKPIRLKQEGVVLSNNKTVTSRNKPISALKRVGVKVGAVMRRSLSKDSLDSNREKEKENLAKPSHQTRLSKGSVGAAGITIMQLEKDKCSMEQQISELVRNAECKKAEIATLKMEIKRLKEKPSEEERDHLRQEMDLLRAENRSLKERLLDLGVPLEHTSLSDSEKEQLLLRRSASGSMASLDSERKDSCQCRKLEGHSPDNASSDVGEASGGGLALVSERQSCQEWDKASSSSQSEMSVACLQDRIMQMEETHYSTNEELQATLQELTDLQDQLTDLQMDNDRMGEDKTVLLESLCSQTEKLEECRSQLIQLKQLLFQQFEDGTECALSTSEKERHYVDLLKSSQNEQDVLHMKLDDATVNLQALRDESGSKEMELGMAQERVKVLESIVDSVNSDKRVLEKELARGQEKMSANVIEVAQLKLQLEKEQQKVTELVKERDANATSELESLLRETRAEKERVEEHSLHLQEQLSLSQREVAKLKEQLSVLQEETKVSKNNARKQLTDLEYQVEQMSVEKKAVQKETELLSEALHEAELKCQRHLEDKRELKANVGDLQKTLTEKNSAIRAAQIEIEELKDKFMSDSEEWKKFQADLLTTVRVANDFKTEAQNDLERLVLENKQLREKLNIITSDFDKLKVQIKKESTSPTHIQRNSPMRSSNPATTTEAATVLSTVERDLASASARRPMVNRGVSQLSVKSLIESIENVTKQVKGQGLSSSRSSSTSSISSIASESRTASLLSNNGDIFAKPLQRQSPSDSNNSSKTNNGQAGHRASRGSISESGSIYSKPGSLPISDANSKNMTDNNSGKPHPVSILANKLDPIRRNSYGFMDVVEKDPLSSLVKGGGSKRNALLKWCQNKTVGYKGIDITNFSSSWNDGLAFCALMHSYLPDLIPYDQLDNKDKRRNFTKAFEAAESVGIPTILNINDLISQERPDWNSIMAYITSIYKHFET